MNLLSSYPYYDYPPDLIGWAGLVLLLAALIVFAIKNPVKSNIKSHHWAQYSVLFLLTGVFSLFFGFHFPGSNSLPPLAFPTIYHSSAVMVFSMIPVALCAGFLNPFSTMVLGAFAGVLIGLWDTHSLFTILEYAGMGLVLSWLFQQRYRSSLFEFLQHPLAAATAVPLLFIPVTLLGLFFSSNGETAIRLDFALTQSWPVITAHFIEFLLAGIVSEVFYLYGVKSWAPGKVSGWFPWDKSLSMKFMARLLPIFVGSFIILLIGTWLTAGIAARELLEGKLDNLSDVAAGTLPYFIETGQNLILDYAGEDLLSAGKTDLNVTLTSNPFFTDLRILDINGNLKESFPDTNSFEVLPEELEAWQLAKEGAPVQTFAVSPVACQKSARIVFVAPLTDKKGVFQGALIGHADLQTNPFTKTAIQAIETVEESGGEGWILDEESRVLFHTEPEFVMTRNYGSISEDDRFYEQTNPGEAPRYIYYQHAADQSWTVVLSVPSIQVQQMAMDIAIPLLIAIAIIFITVIFFIQRLVSQTTRHLHLLAEQATQISKGQLDRPLLVHSPDEVGQLTVAFEQMRHGLKTRLKDINSLLKVSQAAAYNLDPRKTILPVLESFLGKNASSARAVFFDNDHLDATPRISYSYGIGPRSGSYEDLDEVITDLLRDQQVLILTDCSQAGRLKGYRHIPGSLAAFRLQRENVSDGILWAAFENPQQFSETDISFFTALAGQASLAVANANLFQSVEIGRQRMEAVINSSPDPILVFNSNNRLLLLNPAAMEVPQLIMRNDSGAPVDEVVTNHILIEMIRQTTQGGSITRELTMTEGRTYTVSINEVKPTNREVGKICLLRDVSRYKDLDTLKSEFVSTVSHEIQSPLSLMRGYIRMLDLVGETNQQQKNITQKMTATIQQMNELVDNILNLGRIETDEGIYLANVNTVDVVEKIAARMDSKAFQKNIQLIIKETTETGILIRTDPMLLQHALLNLVENGIKYTPNGGRVEISTVHKDGNVIFEIKDNGFGIAPLDQKFIFEKFYRVGQRAAFRQKGTGLGLSIVKTIAERLGGKVWVDSQLGKGSSFYFALPFNPEKE